MNSLSTILVLVTNIFTSSWRDANQACTYPNSCWPSHSEWNALNSSIHGSLVRARPPAYVCHEPHLDEAQCQVARENWINDFWRSQQPGGYHDPAWENGDSYCNIDNDTSVPCDQGLVPIYVAQVKSVADVQAAVKFANKHRISTRVKGASHDFLGRSSGNGTFAIQTINLKGIEFEDGFRPTGAPEGVASQGVVHVFAGEHCYYVYKAASEHGVVVVGGTSYSVGAAGGWVIGGGHSSLSPQYGLGVDNVVQFEIVTPDGELRTANANQNHDLFWALRGGGPGFGVVTKVTYKTHPAITSIVSLTVTATYTLLSYRELLRTYLLLQPTLSARNISGYTYPALASDPSPLFVTTLFVYNSADVEGANATLQPLYNFIQNETAAGRPMTVNIHSAVLTDYFQLFALPLDKVYEGAGVGLAVGGRLLPASLFEEGNVDSLVDLVVQTRLLPGFALVAGNKVGEVAPNATAIHPSWRNSIHSFLLTALWDTNTTIPSRQRLRKQLTEETQQLARLVPGAGSYVNEGDINEPNWKGAFWGSNHERLFHIKKSIDPTGIFTCYHCIGDESD